MQLEFYILLGLSLFTAIIIFALIRVSKESGEEKAERKYVEAELKAIANAKKEAERIKREVSKLSNSELDKYLDK